MITTIENIEELEELSLKLKDGLQDIPLNLKFYIKINPLLSASMIVNIKRLKLDIDIKDIDKGKIKISRYQCKNGIIFKFIY